MDESTSPILTLNQITKIYQMGENKLYALNEVDLQIQAGEFLVVLGPSGSGKSTLLIIGGLNWGLVGLFKLDLVAAIFGKMSLLTRLVYIIVGVAAGAMIYFKFVKPGCCHVKEEAEKLTPPPPPAE